jgi:hypothetical protein
MKLPALKEIIEERKEKAIESLSDSYAKNRLPLEEYERLVEYISKIESERELVVVEKIVAEHSADYERSKTPVYEYEDEDDDDEPDYSRHHHPANNVSIFSSRTFSGRLKPGSDLVTILGSASVKVRKADLAKRQTVFNVTTILGDSVIYVESGIQVKNKIIPILGDASVNNKVDKQAQPGGPELVITGLTLLGSLSVKLIKDEK